ncbi:DUF2087 domain-containing protein [Viridibacillus sp. FSL E2-0187]|uniref:DUF2087 domain-containing protein n=1 Tax=Viridibacillus sp. FSL E2-0187 TaxID=2921362 RepID=UPI0030F5F1BC
MENSELFWNASIDQLKKGYSEDAHCYTCLLCGEKIEKGIIYPQNDVLYEAEKYMQMHIKETHQSVFAYLIGLNKKMTGLTEHQSNLLGLFYAGKTDAEVQQELEIGSASTIRHHRFALKEKERQAKTFLVMMELLKEKDMNAPTFVPVHKTATMVDDRYNITNKEQDEVLNKLFPEGTNGPLLRFPKKEKQKLIILREITNRFEMESTYTEKEINAILMPIHDDYAMIRRYLIEYGFLDRKADGSAYWIKK